MTKLHKKCTYDASTRLGSLEPIVIYFVRKYPPIGFHITEGAYAQLNAGDGELYGRTPYGPWCRLRIFNYGVVSYRNVVDPDEIKQIEEDLYG